MTGDLTGACELVRRMKATIWWAIIFGGIASGASVPVLAGPADDYFTKGEYREALKAYRAGLVLALPVAKRRSIEALGGDLLPLQESLSDKDLRALCRFEQGLRPWVVNHGDEARIAWTEAEKEQVSEPVQTRRSSRRTQLALLRASWSVFREDRERFEALRKAAILINDLPLPSSPWQYSQQVAAEQQILAADAVLRLLEQVSAPGFDEALFRLAADLEQERELARRMTRPPSGAEISYDSFVDELLFKGFGDTVAEFILNSLQSSTAAASFSGKNAANYRLLVAFAALDVRDDASFAKAWQAWVGDPGATWGEEKNTVTLSFLNLASEIRDSKRSGRILKGLAPVLRKVAWPNEPFRVRVSEALENSGLYSAAASLLEAAPPPPAENTQLAGERFCTLAELKHKAGEEEACLTYATRAVQALGDRTPLALHRTMANAFIALKRYKEAVSPLLKCREMATQEEMRMEIAYLLGWVQTLARDYGAARPFFEEVVAAGSSPYTQKAADYLKALPKPAPQP